MTIESNISKNIYTGNGQTTIFPFTYKIWKENEIEIILEDEKGITSTVTPFAVTINKNGGGEVVLYLDNEEKTPIPQGYKIALTRSMPFLQEQDYLNGGRFNAEVIEDNFDMACAERQELKEKVERAVIIPPTSDQTPEEVLQDFLLKYYDIIAKYPEIIHAFATIYPRIEEILTECIANKDLAHAWAESENPPDPNNLESKSAKTWALIASDILPIATDILLGKVKGGGNIIISQDGTMNVEQSILDSIAGNAQAIAINAQAIAINAQAITNLQADKLDKSAISSVLDSESEETVASSKAVNDLRLLSPELSMPSDNYIEYGGIDENETVYTAPANGYCSYVAVADNSGTSKLSVVNITQNNHLTVSSYCSAGQNAILVPIKKGAQFKLRISYSGSITYIERRFYYAEGEI